MGKHERGINLHGPASDPRAPYVRLAVVGLIRRDDSNGVCRWLLLHRKDPVDAWDPPGGRMEEDEDLRAAVTREVVEETGLDVRVDAPCYAFLGVYKGERLLAVTMACRPVGDPDGVRLEPGGASEWCWASMEEWVALATDKRSTWRPNDVRKVTRMALTVQGMEEE